MKRGFLVLIIALIIIPSQKAQAQNDAAIAGIAGLAAIGGAIAAVEAAKEQAEAGAMEFVLSERPDLTNFELKTTSFSGVKMKDISSVSILIFNIKDYENNKRYVLFGFSQSGFSNANGVNYRKANWQMFGTDRWNSMIGSYIELASGRVLDKNKLAKVKVVNKGVKLGGETIIKFDKQKGDVYKVKDYSDDFKLIYNERSLGLFLKGDSNDEFTQGKRSLVQIRRKTIIKAHEFLNNQE
jgi:hypothetical protein